MRQPIRTPNKALLALLERVETFLGACPDHGVKFATRCPICELRGDVALAKRDVTVALRRRGTR